jgi:ketosteroid isomerase-like protein
MSSDNVEIVRGLYEAWNRGEESAALELIDPEIEVEVVSTDTVEFAGTYRGHTGLRKMLAAFWDYFDDPRVQVEECIPAGNDVIAAVHFYARGQTSGAEVDMRRGQVWTLRDGKVVRWRLFASKRDALEAVGLRERADTLTDD